MWQVQEFAKVATTLAGAVDLKKVRDDAIRMAGARISCFVMWMFEASDAEHVEVLQMSCHGNVAQGGSFRVAVTGLRMPRLKFFAARAILVLFSVTLNQSQVGLSLRFRYSHGAYSPAHPFQFSFSPQGKILNLPYFQKLQQRHLLWH